MTWKIQAILLLAVLAAANADDQPLSSDDPCTAHLRTGKKKTVVKIYDSRELGDPSDEAFWPRLQQEFNDFFSIAFAEIDISVCPNAIDNFPLKIIPAYGMVMDDVMMSLCHAPDTWKKLENFFHVLTPSRYRERKGYEKTEENCEVSYPEKKGEYLTVSTHDETIKNKQNIVLYYDAHCTYCKYFYAFWNILYDTFSNEIPMYHMDCLYDGLWCLGRGASGYPSLIYYSVDGNQTEYKGNENLVELKEFINKNKV